MEAQANQYRSLAPLIGLAAEGEACQVCGRSDEVASLVIVDEPFGPEEPGSADRVLVCTRCAAQAIQVVTGFKALRTLESWYRVRDNARNIRLTER